MLPPTAKPLPRAVTISVTWLIAETAETASAPI